MPMTGVFLSYTQIRVLKDRRNALSQFQKPKSFNLYSSFSYSLNQLRSHFLKHSNDFYLVNGPLHIKSFIFTSFTHEATVYIAFQEGVRSQQRAARWGS